MKKISLIILYILSYFIGHAQSFYKIYDFVPYKPHSAYEIVKIDDNNFVVSYFATCGAQEAKCCGLFKINRDGEILEKIQFENFSNSTRALLFDENNNAIYYGGENYVKNSFTTELKIQKVDPLSLEFLDSIELRDSNYNFFSISQKGITKFNDKIVVVGTGSIEYPEVVDTSRSFLYFFNKEMKMDTALYIKFNKSINNQIWEIYVDANGLLTVYFYHNEFDEYFRILKIDSTYKVVWDWEMESKQRKKTPKGCPLSDGRILLVSPLYPFVDMVELIAINHDKSISWKYNWYVGTWPNLYLFNNRSISRIKQLKNGDLIGVGALKDSLHRYWIPSIFRMSSEGELLWEKAFIHKKLQTTIHIGFLADFEETSNGDLIAVGEIYNKVGTGPFSYEDEDIFIVRVDSNGCLYETCDSITEVENIIIGTEDEIKNEDVKFDIYPNPTNGNITIESESLGKLSLSNLQGTVLSTQKIKLGQTTLDLSSYPSGVYFLHFISEGGKTNTKKIIKL